MFFSRSKPRKSGSTWKGRAPRKRARDGHVFCSGGERRSVRKHGGLSSRAYKGVVKKRRAYKSGRKAYRGKAF